MKIFIYCGSSCGIQEDLKLRLAGAGHQVWISASLQPVVRGLDVIDILVYIDGEFSCLGQPPAQPFASVLLEMNPVSLVLLSSECIRIRGISREMRSVHQRLFRNEQIVAQWRALSGRQARIVRAKFRPDATAHIAELCNACQDMSL